MFPLFDYFSLLNNSCIVLLSVANYSLLASSSLCMLKTEENLT